MNSSISNFPDDIPPRLKSEIEWYRKMANRHMVLYETLKTIQIIASVMIPIFAVLLHGAWLKGTAATLGSLVAGIEAFLQFRQFHQHWMRWRATEQELVSEMWLYVQNVGRYTDAGSKAAILAETVENIIRKEREGWLDIQKRITKKESHL